MAEILILSYRLEEVISSYVLHCLWLHRIIVCISASRCQTSNLYWKITIWYCQHVTRPIFRGCDAPPSNLPKGPLLATKWVKNGFFCRRAKGWGSKSPLFGIPAPPQNQDLAAGLLDCDTYINQNIKWFPLLYIEVIAPHVITLLLPCANHPLFKIFIGSSLSVNWSLKMVFWWMCSN